MSRETKMITHKGESDRFDYIKGLRDERHRNTDKPQAEEDSRGRLIRWKIDARPGWIHLSYHQVRQTASWKQTTAVNKWEGAPNAQ